MHFQHTWVASLLAACTFTFTLPAQAGPGHDHGDTATAPTGPAWPRLAAVSENFELVGVLDGRRLTLYLDRYADNSPVPGALIELEIGNTPFKAQALPEDSAVYQVLLPTAPAPGVLPVTATVTAGQTVDLLAGELDLHGEAPHHPNGAALGAKTWAAAAALLAGGLLAWGWRRVQRSRPARVGGLA